MTKNWKRRLAVLLSVMSLMTTGVVVNAALYPNTFYFTLQSGGGKAASASVRKTNSAGYAIIDYDTYSNKSSYGLWYRLRSGTNDDLASDLYELTGIGTKYPYYYSGYGQQDYPYYFRIQTDSNSAYSATVGGSWRP